MLVEGYSEMKKFLPAIEMKGEPTIFDDALAAAQERLVRLIIGDQLETQLEQRAAADHKLLLHCQRVISQDAFLESIPDLDLILTDAGFAVVNNEKVTMASRDRVDSLKKGTEDKLQASRDTLIAYLLRTTAYNSWRLTEEFEVFASALVTTYEEFKVVAVLTNASAKAYPRNWNDYHALLPAMNVSLMTDVASYISKDYAIELIGKIRERTQMSPAEKAVFRIIQQAVASYAMYDRAVGQTLATRAYSTMLKQPDEFPTFAASDEAKSLALEHPDKPIFSMF